MGGRKRKLIHYVATKMDLAHWSVGSKSVDKTVSIARRRKRNREEWAKGIIDLYATTVVGNLEDAKRIPRFGFNLRGTVVIHHKRHSNTNQYAINSYSVGISQGKEWLLLSSFKNPKDLQNLIDGLIKASMLSDTDWSKPWDLSRYSIHLKVCFGSLVVAQPKFLSVRFLWLPEPGNHLPDVVDEPLDPATGAMWAKIRGSKDKSLWVSGGNQAFLLEAEMKNAG